MTKDKRNKYVNVKDSFENSPKLKPDRIQKGEKTNINIKIEGRLLNIPRNMQLTLNKDT